MVTNTCLIDKLISLFGNDLSFNTYIFDRVNVVKKNIWTKKKVCEKANKQNGIFWCETYKQIRIRGR